MQRILPLTIASLVLFVIANIFPIVQIDIRGVGSQTSLLGAVMRARQRGQGDRRAPGTGNHVLFPLLQLTVLFYLLMPSRGSGPPAGFDWLVRSHPVPASLGHDRGVPARRSGRDRQARQHRDRGPGHRPVGFRDR